jgi:hypothetical protein
MLLTVGEGESIIRITRLQDGKRVSKNIRLG